MGKQIIAPWLTETEVGSGKCLELATPRLTAIYLDLGITGEWRHNTRFIAGLISRRRQIIHDTTAPKLPWLFLSFATG